MSFINKRFMSRAGLILINCCYFPAAFAESATWSDVSSNMTDIASVLGRFLMAACFSIGFGFTMSGVLKYKYHRNNPSAVPISVPLLHLLFGIVMMLLALFYIVSSPYVFGNDGGSLHALDPLLMQ